MAAKRGGRLRGLRGMTPLRRLLGRIERDSTAELKEHISRFAKAVENTASARAASGRMGSHRYSIGISSAVSRGGFSADVGLRTPTARKRAWFAHFIEWGTKAGFRRWKLRRSRARSKKKGYEHPGTPAMPVLLPAFEQHRPKFEPGIAAAVRKIINDASIGARQGDE